MFAVFSLFFSVGNWFEQTMEIVFFPVLRVSQRNVSFPLHQLYQEKFRTITSGDGGFQSHRSTTSESSLPSSPKVPDICNEFALYGHA